MCMVSAAERWIFQSTLSVRRATLLPQTRAGILTISIHALRKESDAGRLPISLNTVYFNPRSP